MATYLALMGVGFVACTVIGSLAWYASKRPPGWENAAEPAWVRRLGVERFRAEG